MNGKPLDNINILVTDAEKRIGLYAIRYLGRAGGRISGIARNDGAKKPIGFLSRYIAEKILLEKTQFRQDLKQYLAEHGRKYDFINPIDIAQMLAVIDADREHGLRGAYLLPKRESLVIADNKELLTRHAEAAGLPCPKTWSRIEPEDIRELAHSGGVTFPCIIKFRGDNRVSHWRPEERYSIANSPFALTAEYRRMHAIEPYPIVQEYIQGQGYGFFALYDRNRKLTARFCHKRVREYPPVGGPSSCCESVYDPELDRIGRRLLESLEWSGLAMVEFKFDKTRRQYFIIEVNPRYWGSLPLAVYSGVNFPVLHALSALGRAYEPVTEYRLGTRIRFLETDIKAIMALVGLEESLSKKIKLLLQIFNPAIKDGLITFDDIGPLLGRILGRRKPGPAADADA